MISIGSRDPWLLPLALALPLACSDSENINQTTAGLETTSASDTDSTGEPASTTEGSAGTTAGAETTSDDGDSTDASDSTTDESDDTNTDTSDSESDTSTPDGPPPVIPGPKVKIMTFNIRTGTANDGDNSWEFRKQMVFDVIIDQNPDFFGLQEARHFQLVEIDDNVPGYKRIGVGTVDGEKAGTWNALYYRKSEFKVSKDNTFWLSDTPKVAGSITWGNKFPRVVTWGLFVEKDTQYSFYVYNTHFSHMSQFAREQSAVLLTSKIEGRSNPEYPFAVTGDFNAPEGNRVTRFMKGEAKIDGIENPVPMVDTFREVHPDDTVVGTAHGFTGKKNGSKIDYVYVPPEQETVSAHIERYNVDGKYPSDHYPVLSKVRFTDQ